VIRETILPDEVEIGLPSTMLLLKIIEQVLEFRHIDYRFDSWVLKLL